MKREVPSQKGVQALFTPRQQSKRTVAEVIAATIAVVGAVTWVWALLVFSGSLEPVLLADRITSSILMLSIAIPLIGSGSTLFVYSRTSRKQDETLDEDSLAKEVEALTSSRGNNQVDFTSSKRRVRRSRAEVAAFVEGVVIVILYAGLLRDYDSSVYMRQWVEENLPVATFVLNDNIFFLVVGVAFASAAFHLLARKNEN